MNKWIYAILFTGLLAISTSPVIARLLPLVPAAVISFWRMTFASTMLWGVSSIRPQKSITLKTPSSPGFVANIGRTGFYRVKYDDGILLDLKMLLFFVSLLQ